MVRGRFRDSMLLAVALGALTACPAPDAEREAVPARPGVPPETGYAAPPHTEPPVIPPHTAPHPPPADLPEPLPADTPRVERLE